MKFVYIIFIILLFTIKLKAQHSNPDKIIAYYTSEKIKIDGKLSEQCWLNAKKISNFTQRELNEGQPPTESTMVAICYDKNNLYIGVWAFDSQPDKITAKKLKRDFEWGNDDNFEIMLSTFHDNRNGYLFVINPNGSMADVLITDEGNGFNKSWNGIWEAEVKRNNKGWFAEIRIPFYTLKFPDKEKQVWQINFERNIRRKKEQLMWQGWSRKYELEMISQGGELVGLKNIKSKKIIEIKPYISGGIEKLENKNWTDKNKYGIDVNYNISHTMKLNLTFNTDFAQVESDLTKINLSQFNIFYPEKRQFFLEGKNNFEMNLGRTVRLFHSRTIGINEEEEIPIIAGARIFGKINKTNVGIMTIQTDKKDSVLSTNNSIIRIKQDLFSQSSIGAIITSKYNKDHYNYVYGTDLNFSTSKFLGDKNLQIYSLIAQSKTEGNNNKDNLAFGSHLAYHNDLIEYDLAYYNIQKKFNPELGYLRKENFQMYYTELQLNPRFKKLAFFRNLVFKPIDINYYINNETKKTDMIFYEFRPLGFTTKSGEFFEFNIQYEYFNVDDEFELFENAFVPVGEYNNTRIEVMFATYRGRKLSIFALTSWGDFYNGDKTEYESYIQYYINKHLHISAQISKNDVTLENTKFTTYETSTRFEYSFNPKLYTSLLGQWNNQEDELIINYRINWIPKLGTNFYFVINQTYNTEGKFKLSDTTILTKLIWRFIL